MLWIKPSAMAWPCSAGIAVIFPPVLQTSEDKSMNLVAEVGKKRWLWGRRGASW